METQHLVPHGGTISTKSKTPVSSTRDAHQSRTPSGEAARERLHDAALDLFWKKGYKGTSTREVAASLGVQQASLYYHMATKEQLLHGICYSSLATLIQQAEAAVSIARTPLDAIREIVRNHLTTTLALQKEFSVGVMECRALGPEYRAEIEGLWSRYHMFTSSIIDDAKNDGLIRSDIANKYLYTPLMTTLIWSVLWYRQGRGLTVDELDEIFATIYFEGAARPGFVRNYSSTDVRRICQYLSSPAAPLAPAEKNQTYARLLDTACALFAKQGYNATSIREIADAIGIRKASVYHYISSKEDLLYEISKAALEHINTNVKWALQQVSLPQDRLYALITAHVISLLQHQNWHAAANEELVTFTDERRGEIVALRDDYERLVRSELRAARSAGLIRTDIPIKFLGLVLFGMITHIYPWYQPGIDIPASELGHLLGDLFFTGVAVDRPEL